MSSSDEDQELELKMKFAFIFLVVFSGLLELKLSDWREMR